MQEVSEALKFAAANVKDNKKNTQKRQSCQNSVNDKKTVYRSIVYDNLLNYFYIKKSFKIPKKLL